MFISVGKKLSVHHKRLFEAIMSNEIPLQKCSLVVDFVNRHDRSINATFEVCGLVGDNNKMC